MAESTKESLTKEQMANLRDLNREILKRQTLDMMELVKLPAFLRYVGRHAKECGVYRSIESQVSNNVFRQEGMRKVGETMVDEIMEINEEAKFQMDRMMNKDEKTRRRIKGGEKFDKTVFVEKS